MPKSLLLSACLALLLSRLPAQPAWDDPRAAHWPAEVTRVRIPCPLDGVEQAAYVYGTTQARPMPLLVSLHTWSGDYQQQDPLLAFALRHDWNYIHPDFRGPNVRPEACGSDQVIADLEAAIRFAIAEGRVDAGNIHVIGASGGGYATLLLYQRGTIPVKSFSAWVPISDLERWYWATRSRELKYADHILAATGSAGDKLNIAEARRRSPLHLPVPTELRRSSQLRLYAGIHDGYTGSVPVDQSVRFFNHVVAAMGGGEKDQVPDRLLAELLAQRTLATQREVGGSLLADRVVHLQEAFGPVQLTVFEGRHEMVVPAAEAALLEASYRLRPENPVSEAWLRARLPAQGPRLILSPDLLASLPERMRKDRTLREGYRLLQARADAYLAEPVLEREQTGRRLLSVSREAVARMTSLALVYRLEKDPAYLARLEAELQAVSRFTDWNPDHFLDVAEMSLAVGLALDWAGPDLDPAVRAEATQALIDQALRPSLVEAGYNWWIDAYHNWNLVCHGGLVVGALAAFDRAPAEATAVLQRAVDKLPLGLLPYAPDGIYPEGPSYWFYATDYLTATLSVLESALGTDFGFTQAPGFLASAAVSQLAAGPSGDYYNFFDGSTNGFHSLGHWGLLAWFGRRGQPGFSLPGYRAACQQAGQAGESGDRFAAVKWLYVAQAHSAPAAAPLPQHWAGQGDNPLLILRAPGRGLYLAAKGGRAADNHGNMDAGSFILERDGVRWSLDPGNQAYHPLEEIMGGALWSKGQAGRRWELLTKNNFGHSTLTVNGQPHRVGGRAGLVSAALEGPQPQGTFDLGPVFDQSLAGAWRTFRLVGERLQVVDSLLCTEATDTLTWQMITAAAVVPTPDGAELRQAGQRLRLRVAAPATFALRVIPLDPPPLPYDLVLPGWQRVEVVVPREAFAGEVGRVEVWLE